MMERPAVDYESLCNEAEGLESSLKVELLRFAVLQAEEAQRVMREFNELPRDQQLNKKNRKQVKAASKAFRHLRALLRR